MRFYGVSVALLLTACSGGTGLSSESSASSSEDLKVGDAVLHRLKHRVQGSTVPKNGDVNPYGVAFVPFGFPRGGILRDDDDVLVSNFNNSSNLQGTGTTIVRVNPKRDPTLFFTDPNSPGFSTALGILSRGFVLVGIVPSTDGSGMSCPANFPADTTPVNVGPGAIEIIDRHGNFVSSLTSPFLDGPWDLTVDDHFSRARVFVSSVLTGTVTRLDLDVGDTQITVKSLTQIASGYQHRCDPNAFLIGPTGLALDARRERLYVASTGDNQIFAIDDATDRTTDAGLGTPVVTDQIHLHGPLGLARARNGDLISAQGDAVNPDPNQQNEIVEFTAHGRFVAQFSIDPGPPGAAFGLALDQDEDRFAAVNDNAAVLDIWKVGR